jgi:hypothetical protein
MKKKMLKTFILTSVLWCYFAAIAQMDSTHNTARYPVHQVAINSNRQATQTWAWRFPQSISIGTSWSNWTRTTLPTTTPYYPITSFYQGWPIPTDHSSGHIIEQMPVKNLSLLGFYWEDENSLPLTPMQIIHANAGDTLLLDTKLVRTTGWPTITSTLTWNGSPLLFFTNTLDHGASQVTLVLREQSIPALRAPTNVHSPDLRRELGSTINWIDEITATWGASTNNKIPPMGEIKPVSLTNGMCPILTDNLTTYTKIGTALHSYEIRDTQSLSPDYPFDNTFTTTSRRITVYTPTAPTLRIRYATTADAGFASESYNPHAPLLCGGEDGWTKQPLDISIDPGSIVGTFDTMLLLPDLNTTATNGIATRTNYHMESPNDTGTSIFGRLTAVGDASNELSGTVDGLIKIDRTSPIPAVTHEGEFNFTDNSTDALSGMSLTRPSKIAFSEPEGAQPEIDAFTIFEDIPIMPNRTYDVWVLATDKAGNVAITRVLSDIFLANKVVEITKDTDHGATLHVAGCPEAASVSVDNCTSECSAGANVEIQEKSALTYKLTLTNTDLTDTASGTFEDYLPEGSIVSTMPVVTPAGSATVTFDLESTGSYSGRYKVSGTYADLAPGEQIEIDILSQVPVFDKVITTNNIIRNQASTNWTIGAGASQKTGVADSNYTVHELTDIPSVETRFTKVGADNLDFGLTEAEFALYRWNGALAPTTEELNHMVDPSMVVDNTLAGGDWVRVTYDGEDATALTDIFTPATEPRGVVDLGDLPTGIYTLIETKAPVGYALPVGQWILMIDSEKDNGGADDWQVEFIGKSHTIMPPAAIRDTSGSEPVYQLVNAKPFVIGMSGLSGTNGLLLLGFVIMALAGNTYLVNAYKQNKKNETQ